MTEDGNRLGDTYLRWIVGGVMTACLGLASVLWSQSNQAIAELRARVETMVTQVADMKSDVKLLNAKQQEISDRLAELTGQLNPKRTR